MSDDDLDFDAMMRGMGVRPLEKRAKAPSKGRSGSPSKAARRASSPRAPVPKSSLPQGARGGTQRTASPPVSTERQLAVELTALREAQAAWTAEQARLVGELERVSEERDALKAQVDDLEAGQGELDTHRRSLQRHLTALRGDRNTPTTLADLFRQRGLIGESEAVLGLRALDSARRLPDLLKMLSESEGSDVAGFLDEHLVMLGGCAACPTVDSRAVLQVPMHRCEVCEGSDVRREVRAFEDACLLRGLRRITVIGGSPRYRRQLRDFITDARLRLRLHPGALRRTRKQARQDLEGSDLVVIWGSSILDHSVSELYVKSPDDRVRLLRVASRGMTSMMRELVGGLERSDDAR